jgi:hypothetical protein
MFIIAEKESKYFINYTIFKKMLSNINIKFIFNFLNY